MKLFKHDRMVLQNFHLTKILKNLPVMICIFCLVFILYCSFDCNMKVEFNSITIYKSNLKSYRIQISLSFSRVFIYQNEKKILVNSSLSNCSIFIMSI